MITHRLHTRPTPEPPVRFYRTVAITFLILTIALLGIVIFITSKKATIVVVAKEDIKPVNLTVSIGKEPGTDTITGSITSTVFKWTEKYFPTGNKMSTGTSGGEIVVYNKSDQPQTLIKTTRFLSLAGVLFRLSDKIIVPANGQITAAVYADQAGPGSDIAPTTFIIPGLNEARQKQIYGESVKPMSGGTRQVGILTEDDIKSAKTDYNEKVKAAFASTFASTTLGLPKIVLVADQTVASNHLAGEEVAEYKVAGTSTVIAVFYNQNDLSNLLSKEVYGQVDTGSEKILNLDKPPQATVTAYDLTKNTAQLSVSQDVSVTLDANAEKLAVTNFLGKSKDEIERYILGLNHVSGVEVKFTPAWMQSAPSVPDRISIMVKNVQ